MLIETMLYGSLLIFLATVSMSYVADSYMHIDTTVRRQTNHAQQCIVRDVLIHDLSQAPIHKSLWKLITDNEHVWTTAQGDVGFAHTPHGIVRSQGIFDAQKKKWVRRTKSVCAPRMRYHIQPIHEDKNCFYLLQLAIIDFDHTQMTTNIALRTGTRL